MCLSNLSGPSHAQCRNLIFCLRVHCAAAVAPHTALIVLDDFPAGIPLLVVYQNPTEHDVPILPCRRRLRFRQLFL